VVEFPCLAVALQSLALGALNFLVLDLQVLLWTWSFKFGGAATWTWSYRPALDA